jgi:hypothetical protein
LRRVRAPGPTWPSIVISTHFRAELPASSSSQYSGALLMRPPASTVRRCCTGAQPLLGRQQQPPLAVDAKRASRGHAHAEFEQIDHCVVALRRTGP